MTQSNTIRTKINPDTLTKECWRDGKLISSKTIEQQQVDQENTLLLIDLVEHNFMKVKV